MADRIVERVKEKDTLYGGNSGLPNLKRHEESAMQTIKRFIPLVASLLLIGFLVACGTGVPTSEEDSVGVTNPIEARVAVAGMLLSQSA